MVEREQGRGQTSDEATEVESRHSVDVSTVRADAASEEDPETVRRARFLEALDEVMRDHHNVLAALAK